MLQSRPVQPSPHLDRRAAFLTVALDLALRHAEHVRARCAFLLQHIALRSSVGVRVSTAAQTEAHKGCSSLGQARPVAHLSERPHPHPPGDTQTTGSSRPQRALAIATRNDRWRWRAGARGVRRESPPSARISAQNSRQTSTGPSALTSPARGNGTSCYPATDSDTARARPRSDPGWPPPSPSSRRLRLSGARPPRRARSTAAYQSAAIGAMVCPTRSHTKVFLRDWLDLARGKLSPAQQPTAWPTRSRSALPLNALKPEDASSGSRVVKLGDWLRRIFAAAHSIRSASAWRWRSARGVR